ncbi:hypothetical protein PPERSA_05548 [Pseudocohnilembus persalinus]|uniref:Uncharacterized protein n=1 Tax=Pseudocohnilembus persalinus TaxID=266149 RepID=A0A0V0QSZ3_PSEPJ|nr:hypothetical protein PPERSA_05548 [Pseudocohnilembus persalinus]|eukprot:KRX05439.1 hypothetical protein PPERSA_05548 [Pseudocohnilembus persalinus]
MATFMINGQISTKIENKFLIINKISICRSGKYCFPCKSLVLYSTISKEKNLKYDRKLEEDINSVKNDKQLRDFLLQNRQFKISKTNIPLLKEISQEFDDEQSNSQDLQYAIFDKNQQQIIPPTTYKQHKQYYQWFVEQKTMQSLDNIDKSVSPKNSDQQKMDNISEQDDFCLSFEKSQYDEEEYTNNNSLFQEEIYEDTFSNDRKQKMNSLSDLDIKQEDEEIQVEDQHIQQFEQNQYKFPKFLYNKKNDNEKSKKANKNNKRPSIISQQDDIQNISFSELDSQQHLNYSQKNSDFKILAWISFVNKKVKTQSFSLNKNNLISARQFRLQLIDFNRKKKYQNVVLDDINLNYLMLGGQMIN